MKVFLPVNVRIDDKKILFVGGGMICQEVNIIDLL